MILSTDKVTLAQTRKGDSRGLDLNPLEHRVKQSNMRLVHH